MHNDFYKSDYISKNHLVKSEAVEAEKIFDMIDTFERMFGLDACRFTKEQALEFFDSLSAYGAVELNSVKNLLSDYARWCQKCKYTDCNVYKDISFFYNQTRKEEYISEENSRQVCKPANFLEHILEEVAIYEYKHEKDLCDFTKTEILGLYNCLNRPSISSLDVIHSCLSNYVQWCGARHLILDNINHFTEISRSSFSEYINIARREKTTLTYSDINHIVNISINPSDAFIVLALFEGISGQDFCELRKLKFSDFDVSNNTVKLCTGRIVKASDKLIELAELSSKEYVYYRFGDNKVLSLVEADDTVIKSMPNTSPKTSEHQQSRRIAGKFRRTMDFAGFEWVSTKDIERSGKIHMVNKRSEELNVMPHDYLSSNYIKEINSQFLHPIKCSTFEINNMPFLKRA